MWPFKVQDSACLVHQGLTQSSYSINICSVNEEPFNNWEHIPLQSNRLWTHSEITSAFLPLQIQESEHKEGTLHQVKIPQWLWSLRLNIIFSSCLRVFRVPSFDQWSRRNLKEQKKNMKRLSLFISYFGCCTRVWSRLEPFDIRISQQPCSQLCYPSTPKSVRGFNRLLIIHLYLVIISV